jgi:hypothetical protein
VFGNLILIATLSGSEGSLDKRFFAEFTLSRSLRRLAPQDDTGEGLRMTGERARNDDNEPAARLKPRRYVSSKIITTRGYRVRSLSQLC